MVEFEPPTLACVISERLLPVTFTDSNGSRASIFIGHFRAMQFFMSANVGFEASN